jgi:ubiquinone/menaquinone biosynthesis C-methylase UbiE
MRLIAFAFLSLLTTSCDVMPSQTPSAGDVEVESSAFPKAARPVAPIVSSRWSTEQARDQVQEADTVMDLAGITPGMTVSDIGAGEGYYTVRLSGRVGPSGRVLAQDLMPKVRDKLADRVTRENLDNVSVMLGDVANPKLPANSFDRVFLVRMYHEIGAPYEFMWRLRPALRVGGRVIIVDADRRTDQHGTPPALLKCELAEVGYRQIEFHSVPQIDAYVAVFEASGKRPGPNQIKTCQQK